MSAGAWTAVTLIGAAGAGALGWLLYGHRDGLKALKQADEAFQSPEERLYCPPEAVFACFERLDGGARARLRRCWRLGIVFLMFFGLALLAVVHNVAGIRLIQRGMYLACAVYIAMAMLQKALLHKACRVFPARRLAGVARVAGAAGLAKWLAAALWVAGLFISLFWTAFQL